MLVSSILVNIVSGLIITNYEHVFFIEIYNSLSVAVFHCLSLRNDILRHQINKNVKPLNFKRQNTVNMPKKYITRDFKNKIKTEKSTDNYIREELYNIFLIDDKKNFSEE